MKRFLAMLMTALCLCSVAFAQEPATLGDWLEENIPAGVNDLFANETQITTVGESQANAPIDVAIVSFLLKIEGETVDEANVKVTDAINTLRDSLIAQGVEEESIWRKTYDVSPNVVYHNTKLTDGEIIEGFLVDMVVCVRLTDISLIGKVIDAATQSGAGGTHELQFERSTLPQVYQAALTEATRQAGAKAQSLAEGLGMTLGDVVSVVEMSCEADETARVEVTYRAK